MTTNRMPTSSRATMIPVIRTKADNARFDALLEPAPMDRTTLRSRAARKLQVRATPHLAPAAIATASADSIAVVAMIAAIVVSAIVVVEVDSATEVVSRVAAAQTI